MFLCFMLCIKLYIIRYAWSIFENVRVHESTVCSSEDAIVQLTPAPASRVGLTRPSPAAWPHLRTPSLEYNELS